MNNVTMTAGNTVISLPAAAVRQVIPARGLTSIPMSREGVLGVVVHDHQAVPVFRLDGLDLPAAASGQGTASGPRSSPGQIVILEQEGALAGFLVEATVTVSGEPESGLFDHRTILAAAGVLPDEAWGRMSTDSVRGDE